MPTTWNPGDLLNTTLSGSNLTATATSSTGGVRSLANVASGKYYWELTINGYSGGIQAGTGIGNASASLSGAAFNSTNIAMHISSGNCYVAGALAGSITSVQTGVICYALDMGARRFWMRGTVTGSWNATSGTANDPATGVGGFDVSGIVSGATPALAMALFGGTGMIATGNFGSTAFSGAVPSGFTAGFGPAAGSTQARGMILA